LGHFRSEEIQKQASQAGAFISPMGYTRKWQGSGGRATVFFLFIFPSYRFKNFKRGSYRKGEGDRIAGDFIEGFRACKLGSTARYGMVSFGYF
jgi:hypothetical protein